MNGVFSPFFCSLFEPLDWCLHFLVQHAIRLGYFVWGPPFALDPAERFFLSLSSLPCVCPRTYQEAGGKKISWIVFLN